MSMNVSLWRSSAFFFTHPVNPVFPRFLSLSLPCHKGNTRRPRLASSRSTSMSEKLKARQSATQQALATSNRKKWEEASARLIELSGRLPTTEVYFAPKFEPKLYSVVEAIECLREAAHPDMYDCLQNPVRVKFTLNMRTSKKTRFIQKFAAHIILPHLLDFRPKSRVIALCQDADDTALALAHGAFEAGCDDLFSRLQHGTFHREEYDAVVAHPHWESSITKLKHVLKDRLPTKKNGQIDEDVASLVATYTNGINLESTFLEGVPEIAFLDVIVGQLIWDVSRLEDNMKAYFNIIQRKKSSRVAGTGIISAELFCPPTGEYFQLDCSPFFSINNGVKPSEESADVEQDSLLETEPQPDERVELST